jgi:hypothetical protein
MKRIGTRARFVLGAVILALTTHVLTARLNAQETRGKITGRITDTSKAILPGATVTVTDVARNTVLRLPRSPTRNSQRSGRSRRRTRPTTPGAHRWA